VALGLLTLWLLSIVVFAAVALLPGDAATAILGRDATPARVAALRAELHLEDSVFAQYLTWISGVVHGDFGMSAAAQVPVSELLHDRILNTAFLVLVAALVAVPLPIVLGVWTALRRDTPAEGLLTTTLLVLAAVPEFVLGITLVFVFATGVVQWFPAVSLLAPGERPWSDPAVLILPAATLVLAVVPYVSRIMRGSMIEVLESDYIAMARLSGLPERWVIWRHGLPNAIAPALQVTALQLAWMVGGVVLVEVVFSYPGIGSALVDAVSHRDIPVVQAITLLAGGAYVLLNLLADLATVFVTPKLRTTAR
jgi:peptide/nickel transport system permease protein